MNFNYYGCSSGKHKDAIANLYSPAICRKVMSALMSCFLQLHRDPGDLPW